MDQPTLYPVIDNVIAGPKLFGDLLDGQFLGLLEHSRRDLMAFADPLDHLRRIRLARGTEITFSIELIPHLRIEEAASQIADAVDNRARIAYAVCYVRRKLHREVGAGAALPTDVNQELFLMRWLLHGNVL